MEWNVFLMGSKKDQRDANAIINETDFMDMPDITKMEKNILNSERSR